MKINIRFVLPLLLACSCINSAQAATSTATVNASATLLPGCIFASLTTKLTTATIPTGGVGKVQMPVSFTCTNNVSYTIRPLTNTVTIAGAEPVVIRIFKDAARTQPLTRESPMTGIYPVDTNSVGRLIYFRVNAAEGRPDRGEGPVLTTPQTFSGTMQLEIAY